MSKFKCKKFLNDLHLSQRDNIQTIFQNRARCLTVSFHCWGIRQFVFSIRWELIRTH